MTSGADYKVYHLDKLQRLYNRVERLEKSQLQLLEAIRLVSEVVADILETKSSSVSSDTE